MVISHIFVGQNFRLRRLFFIRILVLRFGKYKKLRLLIPKIQLTLHYF